MLALACEAVNGFIADAATGKQVFTRAHVMTVQYYSPAAALRQSQQAFSAGHYAQDDGV
jgi:hypothetical protein